MLKKSARAARSEGWAGVKMSPPGPRTCSGERDGREAMAAVISAKAQTLAAPRSSQPPQFLEARMRSNCQNPRHRILFALQKKVGTNRYQKAILLAPFFSFSRRGRSLHTSYTRNGGQEF